MTVTFPRLPDGEPHAWGLTDGKPREVWERFSPAYEAQAERLVRAVEARGWTVHLGGAGSEDGEYLWAERPGDRSTLLCHLEEPAQARCIAALDDDALGRWLDEELPSLAAPGGAQDQTIPPRHPRAIAPRRQAG